MARQKKQTISVTDEHNDEKIDLKCLIEKLTINNDRLTKNNEKLTIVIENQEKIIKKLNEAADKSDLKTFAEITKINLNNTLQKNLSTTINKTLNEKKLNEIRNKTIILYNVKQTIDSNYETRNFEEKKNITEILDLVNTNYNIKNYFRLGKYQENDNVIRPLKIILNSEIEINNIIQNANKLKNSKFKNISISKEYNKVELDTIKKLSIEAKHKSTINNKYVVRHRNDTFKIIELKKRDD